MTKYVIYDYFAAFSIDRIKEQNSNSIVAFFVIYVVIMPFIRACTGYAEFTWGDFVIYTAVFLPMVLTYFSALLHPARLSKMMYLCPNSVEERKKYIYQSYYFRVGIHMLLFVIGICVVVPISYCDIFSAIQILLNDVLMAIVICQGRRAEKNKKGIDKGQLFQIAIFPIGYVSNIFQIGIQLPLAVKYGKYIKKELQAAISFEEIIDERG